MTLQEQIDQLKTGAIVSDLDALLHDTAVDHEARIAATEAGVSGLGAAAVYDHEDDVGTVALLAADADARVVLITAVVTEATAGTTTEPLFSIGEEDGAADKFGAIGEGEDAGTLGTKYIYSGTLTADKDLEITVADGTGGAEAGKVAITVLAFPAVS